MYDELVKKIRRCATDPMHCLSCDEDKDGRCFARLMTQAADAIAELSKPRWIPVTEALPLRGDAVLCVGDNGISIADFVCGDKWSALPWFYVDGEQETNVTHWMPLPEPPKGGVSMTDTEFKKNIPSLTNEELMAKLRYYGCDRYYRDLWDKVCAEIAARLGVDWEDMK